MAGAVVVMQPPGLAPGMLDVLEVGSSSVVIPDLTAAPGTDVKYVVESGFDDPTMADGDDDFFTVLFHKFLDE